MMTPITMYDTVLSANVDLYQIGLPDAFGANALVYFKKGTKTYPETSEMSVLNDQSMWMTVNIKRLEPIA